MVKLLLLVLSLLAICPLAEAKDRVPQKNKAAALREQGPVTTISPIFGQLVMFSSPKGFIPVYENSSGDQYIREAVLTGESTNKWSQMVTVTGTRGLASNREVTPQAFANGVAGGFKDVCPTSFSGAGLGGFKIGKHDAFAAVVGCGVANPAGNPHSETMLLIVIKGDSDYYTIQWAERGAASRTPIKFDDAKWADRLKKLTPIKLCPIIPGESAPYPSCVGGA